MAQSLLVVPSDGAELPELERRLDELGVDYELAADTDSRDAEYILTVDNDTEASVFDALWKRRTEADLWMVSRVPTRGLSNRLYRRVLSLPYYDYGASMRLYHASAVRRGGCELAAPNEALLKLHAEGFKVKEMKSPAAHHSRPSLLALPHLRRIRSGESVADAEDRAYTSRAPLRAKWLKRRYDAIVSCLEVEVPWLAVGFGSSRLVQILARGTCVDQDVRKLRYLRGRVKALAASAPRSLPFQDESFPQLACGEIAVVPALAEFRRVLQPGGTLVVTASDPASLAFRALRPLRAWMGAPLRSTSNLYRRPELEAALREAGFRIDEVKRVFRTEWVIRAIRE